MIYCQGGLLIRNRPGNVLARGAQRQHGLDNQVNGGTGIAGFHFCHAGLTGADHFGNSFLGETLALSTLPECAAQSDFQIYQRAFLVLYWLIGIEKP